MYCLIEGVERGDGLKFLKYFPIKTIPIYLKYLKILYSYTLWFRKIKTIVRKHNNHQQGIFCMENSVLEKH
jgi:hypothetical protein